MATTTFPCPACNFPLQLTLAPAPYPHPPSSPAHPAPPPTLPAVVPAPPSTHAPSQPAPPTPPTRTAPAAPATPPAPVAPAAPPTPATHPAAAAPGPPGSPAAPPVPAAPTAAAAPAGLLRRLSPQATLLTLGVLLLLAAGVTFLAVNWHSLPVPAQAAIIATLAACAFAGSVPASRRTLTGTAEALAILGTGLLAVDLFGARALGLIPTSTVDAPTYSAIVFTTIAVLAVLMTRAAPKVVTYGVTTVIAAQLPLPLVLVDRTTLPVILGAVLVQAICTLYLSARGTQIVRRTGAFTVTVVFCGILLTGTARTLWGLMIEPELSITVPTAAVVCLAATTGIAILQRRPLPASIPPALGEAVCAAAAAFAVATTLPQIAAWLTTAFATALAITALVALRRTETSAVVLHTATITAAAVDIAYCAAVEDVRQLGYIAAILAVLAVVAAVRKVTDPVPTAAVASFGAQLAIILFALDEYVGRWPAAVALAAVGAIGIAVACAYVGTRMEPALLTTAACSAVLAEIAAVTTSSGTATGVVLTLTAAPLVAYGIDRRRRPALVIAAALLIAANTTFMLGAEAHTLEWYTIPPALVLLAAGILAWRNLPSWIHLGPGLLVGLLPSTLAADTTGNWLRATFVVAAAVVLILIGVRRGLQAPFLVGAAAVAKIGVAQFLEVAPLIPRWITLATAGLILLATGATYERRLTQTKKAARWIANLR